MVNKSLLNSVYFILAIVLQFLYGAAFDGIRDWTEDEFGLDASNPTWFVRDPKTSAACILFHGGIRIGINGTLIDIPLQASASGSCGSELQTLRLEWGSCNGGTNNVSLNFVDTRDRYIFPVSKTSYILESITGNLDLCPKDKNNTEQFNFSIREGMIRYYIDMDSSCFTQDSIRDIDDKVEVQFIDVRLEAFHLSSELLFSYASGNCFGSNASYSLFLMSLMCAGLIIVVIVLVIILVGRKSIGSGRRNSIDGYERI